MKASELCAMRNDPAVINESLEPLFATMKANIARGFSGIDIRYCSFTSEFMNLSDIQIKHLESLGYKVEKVYLTNTYKEGLFFKRTVSYTYLARIKINPCCDEQETK